MNRKSSYLFLACCIIFFGVYSFFGGSTKIDLDFADEELNVELKDFQANISYAEIESLEYVEVTDFGTVADGGETNDYRWGRWENGLFGEYTQCTTKNTDYCVVIRLTDGECFALSYEGEQSTSAISEMMYKMLNSRGYSVVVINDSIDTTAEE